MRPLISDVHDAWQPRRQPACACDGAARCDWLFLAGGAAWPPRCCVALVLLDGQPASAALIGLGFALGIAFFRAEFSFTAAWRRFLVRGEARRAARRVPADRGRGARHRAGRGAGAGLRRRDRADRALARHRRLRVRHRHAARQWLRLRHALHRRQRRRPHADRARLLHRRQRDRQPAPAGVPGARRRRSDPRVELPRPWGGLAVTLASIAARGGRS